MNAWNDPTKVCTAYPLPGISNSKDPIFQTIISTFETRQEAENMLDYLIKIEESVVGIEELQ